MDAAYLSNMHFLRSNSQKHADWPAKACVWLCTDQERKRGDFNNMIFTKSELFSHALHVC